MPSSWKRLKVERTDLDGFITLEVLDDGDLKKDSSLSLSPEESSEKETDANTETKDETESGEIKTEHTIPPTSEWYQLGLEHRLVLSLFSNGYESPLPVQRLALPKAIRMRNDVLVAAETGSGKTLAYVLPILHQILRIRLSLQATSKAAPEINDRHLRALIMTPTRELATQVDTQIMKLSKDLGIYSVAIVGGISQKKHERLLKKRPEIVVATPGRLWSYMNDENGENGTTLEYLTALKGLKVFVVDEVDRMLENGHFEELGKISEMVNQQATNAKKFVLSATLLLENSKDEAKPHKRPSPGNLDKAKHNQHKKIMQVLGVEMKKAQVIDMTNKNVTPSSLKEYRVFCDELDKEIHLYNFLSERSNEKTIVFFNKVDSAKRVGGIFEKLLLEKKPTLLFGSQKQRRRFEAVESLNAEKSALLFTTDVAARGLDFANVHNVVHFDVPVSGDSYVHRSGRSGRCSRDGLSLLLVAPEEIHKYRKVLNSVNRAKDVNEFPKYTFKEESMSQHNFKDLKNIFKLAKTISENESHIQTLEKSQNWFKKQAKLADIEIDPDHCKAVSKDRIEKLQQLRLDNKSQKSRLKQLLRKLGSN